ncbi:MAG TPA: hypothetical protein VI636_15620 [Candidatus Angelobacter sp.]
MSELSFHVSSRSRTFPVFLVALGAGVAIYGLLAQPERTWPNLLLDGFYVASMGISAVFFLAVTRAAGARWSANLRRVPEALSSILPAAGVLLALMFFGRQTLFPWTRPGYFAKASAIAGNVHYLNPPWALARMALTLAAWIFFAWLFRRTSLQQDREANSSLALHHRLNRYGVVFLLAFALTFTFAVYDWLLSLDPQWSSTMFAFYTFAGTFVQGIAGVTLAVVLLKERGTLTKVSEHQLHDLGKMLFAFTIFWAYIWTCQYLLIWYGNIPDEITHYLTRTNGPWLYLFALNFILNWIVPFTTLLTIRAKRNTKVLKMVCVVVLVGHWLDLYMLIMPSMWRTPKIGLIEIPIAAGYGALAYLIFVRTLQKAPLAPLHDPIVAYEQVQQVYAAELHTS